MKKKNGVKIIQTAGYNGARTVTIIESLGSPSSALTVMFLSCSQKPKTVYLSAIKEAEIGVQDMYFALRFCYL